MQANGDTHSNQGPARGSEADAAAHHAANGNREPVRKGAKAMCGNCVSEGIGRRDVLKFGAAGAVAFGLVGGWRRARAAEGAPTSLSPDEAFGALKSGNERYVNQPQLCSIDLAEQRTVVAAHQAP